MDISVNNIGFKVDEKALPKKHSTFWDKVNNNQWGDMIIYNFIDEIPFSAGDVCLDVGSWVGPISLYLAAKGLNVKAFEPDSVAYNYLSMNVQCNDFFDKISIYNYGICDSDGDVDLGYFDEFGSSTSSVILGRKDAGSSRVVTAHMKTFDSAMLDIYSNKNRFIKIDIEGSEILIIDDLIKFIDHHQVPPYLFIELHPFLDPKLFNLRSESFMKLFSRFNQLKFLGRKLGDVKDISPEDIIKRFKTKPNEVFSIFAIP